jgi:hypothetical protein
VNYRAGMLFLLGRPGPQMRKVSVWRNVQHSPELCNPPRLYPGQPSACWAASHGWTWVVDQWSASRDYTRDNFTIMQVVKNKLTTQNVLHSMYRQIPVLRHMSTRSRWGHWMLKLWICKDKRVKTNMWDLHNLI